MSVWEWIYYIVVEGLKYIIIGRCFLGYEFNQKKTKYLLLLYPLLIPVVEWLKISDLIQIYRNIWVFFLLLCLFQENVLEKAKSSIVIWFLVTLMDAIIIVPVFMMLVITEQTIGMKMLVGCIGCFIWGISAWKFSKIKRYVQEFWQALSLEEYALLVLILFVISFFIGGIQGYSYNAITSSKKGIVFMLGVITVILFCFICVLLFYTRRSKRDLEEINLLNTSYFKLQRKYYEDSLKQYEDMRRFRHDIHKHIYVLSELNRENKVKELKEYIEKMAESYEKVQGIHTGNFIADCIVSYAIKDLQKENFEFLLDGHFSEKFFMEDIDFCIVLFNLFDNAKEALEKVEGRKILQLEIKRYRQWLYIILRNNVVDELVDFSCTSKSDGGHHGYGMQNVRRVVEKYGGTIRWEQKREVVEVKMKFEIEKEYL